MKWKPVCGYENRYEVSSSGLVRKALCKSLIGQWSKSGYMLVRLSQPRKLARVHRLVAEAFIKNSRNLPLVNHIDFDTSNNSAINLEWCTQKENLAHSDRHGRMVRNHWLGKRSPTASLSDEQAAELRSEYSSGKTSYSELGKKYGLCKRSVGRIVLGERYRPTTPPPEATP